MKNFVLVIAVILLVLTGCKGKEKYAVDDIPQKILELKYAEGIVISKQDGGWNEVLIKNPWDTTKVLQTLALIPDSLDEIPYNARGKTIIRTPLKNSLVQTTVHIGLFEEFGAGEAIRGVSDAAFIKSPSIHKKLDEGTIVDCGTWMNPSLEKIVLLNPDAIFVSPYEYGGSYGHMTELGIPIVYVADYMENEPLGRAEWMKFYGMLYGRENEADSIFQEVEKKYRVLTDSADSISLSTGKKSIILDLPFQGSWYAAGCGSSNDRFINDAGAVNPMSYVAENKIVPVSTEEMISKGSEALVWVIRYNSSIPITKELIEKDYPFVNNFKSFRNGDVWVCNTNETSYYEETPFHPEKVLHDLVTILYNPAGQDSLLFFTRL